MFGNSQLRLVSRLSQSAR